MGTDYEGYSKGVKTWVCAPLQNPLGNSLNAFGKPSKEFGAYKFHKPEAMLFNSLQRTPGLISQARRRSRKFFVNLTKGS